MAIFSFHRQRQLIDPLKHKWPVRHKMSGSLILADALTPASASQLAGLCFGPLSISGSPSLHPMLVGLSFIYSRWPPVIQSSTPQLFPESPLCARCYLPIGDKIDGNMRGIGRLEPPRMVCWGVSQEFLSAGGLTSCSSPGSASYSQLFFMRCSFQLGLSTDACVPSHKPQVGSSRQGRSGNWER